MKLVNKQLHEVFEKLQTRKNELKPKYYFQPMTV